MFNTCHVGGRGLQIDPPELRVRVAMEEFEWEKHKTELDRIFFKDFPLVPR